MKRFCKTVIASLALLMLLRSMSASADPAAIEKGRYLAIAGDCVACHTKPGGAPFAGGRRLATPFGILYTSNLTPDVATGIGGWSEFQFARAVREGIGADGAHLYPALPYTAYTLITDQDVSALWAYLHSLQPISHPTPANEMRFPFDQRNLLAGWKMLFFQDGRFVPDPARSQEWNRGAYLVRGLGHCGACHTPRNFLGGEKTTLALTGGEYLDEVADAVVDGRITAMDERTVRPWAAANLTQTRSGLAAWSVEDIAAYLKTGHSARAAGFGPMSEVIGNSTRHLTDEDVHAIALYLKSLVAITQGTPSAAPAELMRTGEIVYTARCGDCHLPTGLGIARARNQDNSKTAPPLAGSAALQAPSPATLINVILYGAHEVPDLPGAWPDMSGFELSVGLDDAHIAALATYVRGSWGNRAAPVDAAAVARQH